MDFEELARHDPSSLALVLDSPFRRLSYGELIAEVGKWRDVLSRFGPGSCGILVSANELFCVALYLASQFERQVLLLIGDDSPLGELVAEYAPAYVVQARSLAVPAGYVRNEAPDTGCSFFTPALRGESLSQPRPFAALRLLLSTSGSTGSKKFARLSAGNLSCNADAIARGLRIERRDIGLLYMPLDYSYGLSILNSHFYVGAAIALTKRSIVSPDFWQFASASQCTFFPGVPQTYRVLQTLQWHPRACPTIRCLTQAGGRLALHTIDHFHRLMAAVGGEMYVMYGQTEATARMTILQSKDFEAKRGSVGLPIRGGAISLAEATDSEQLELVYRGPNVMLGYCTCRNDLSEADHCRGVLHTGDFATIDQDGYCFLQGRLKRIAKISGYRVALDEIETLLTNSAALCCAVVESAHGHIDIFVQTAGETFPERRHRGETTLRAALPRLAGHCHFFRIDALPLTTNGKIDYRRLHSA